LLAHWTTHDENALLVLLAALLDLGYQTITKAINTWFTFSQWKEEHSCITARNFTFWGGRGKEGSILPFGGGGVRRVQYLKIKLKS